MSEQLLDLMHTLHTRAASIYSSWAEEQRHLEASGKKIEADSQTLWTSCWCPLLQGGLRRKAPLKDPIFKRWENFEKVIGAAGSLRVNEKRKMRF